MDPIQEDFDPAVDSKDNGGYDDGMNEDVEDSLEMDPLNLKENLGARPSNTSKNLDNSVVGLKLQLKMLKFMDFVNQKLKIGKEKTAWQDKMSSSLWCKVLGLLLNKEIGQGKNAKYLLLSYQGKNVKECFIEIDKYYDV